MSLLAADARGAADWGALATAFGAAVALLVGVVTVLQKTQADRRAEWWNRAQWAVDHAVSTRDEEAEIGLISMTHLIESPAATDDDVRFMRDVAQNIAEREP
ncbi:hypothetical protein ACI784_09260 [Geodermatophilus sp. SYSU D01186]